MKFHPDIVKIIGTGSDGNTLVLPYHVNLTDEDKNKLKKFITVRGGKLFPSYEWKHRGE